MYIDSPVVSQARTEQYMYTVGVFIQFLQQLTPFHNPSYLFHILILRIYLLPKLDVHTPKVHTSLIRVVVVYARLVDSDQLYSGSDSAAFYITLVGD